MKNTKKTVLMSMLSCAALACIGFSVGAAEPATANAAEPSQVFYLTEGASIRKSDDKSGIRFRALLQKDAFDSLKETYANAAVGMIMLPTDALPTEGAVTLGNLNSADIAYHNEEYTALNTLALEKGGTKYYHFSLAIYDLKDFNYARDMSTYTYIKLPGVTGIENATVTLGGEQFAVVEEGGDSYIYAQYDEEKHARNMYEVACKAQEEDQANDVIRGYMDNVAVIDTTGGAPVIVDGANNHEAPYEIIAEANGDYSVRNNDVEEPDELKCLVVDGEIQREYPVSLGGTKSLNVIQRSEGTQAADDQVTMSTFTQTSSDINLIQKWNLNYMAFEGKYAVGTYLSVTFTGNNMPYVMFFANNINTKIANKYDTTTQTWETEDKGVLFMNGACTETNGTPAYGNAMAVYGPHKIDLSVNGGAAMANSTSVDNNWWHSTSMQKLATTNAEKTYTMVIGTEIIDGVLNIVEHVYEVTNVATVIPGNEDDHNSKPSMNYICTNSLRTDAGLASSITEADIEAGSIILYAPMKGNGTATFTYTAPQTGVFEPNGLVKGKTPATDGTVTHTGENLQESGCSWNNYGAYAVYTAYMGNYGVGTYIDFAFKGKLLPQVMFFGKVAEGDEANIGNFSTYGTGTNNSNSSNMNRQGVIVMNIASTGGLHAYGPNRLIRDNGTGVDGANSPKTGAGAVGASESALFNDTALDADTNYKYTVGTCLKADGVTVQVYAKLVSLGTDAAPTAETTVAEETFDLGTSVTKDMKGYICIHLPYSNSVVYQQSYTFQILRMPYTK